jgi:Uncharacterized protein conserved in bacteria
MTLTPAMSRALELHPFRSLPKTNAWDNTQDQVEAVSALNRIGISITDDNWPKKVLAFHRLYGVPGGEGAIANLSARRQVLRRRLLEEEVSETLAADEAGDLIEVVDGLLDTVYVAIGWLLELGLTAVDINRAMEEVHASNMTKVDNEGKPVFDEGGKVLKGENYVRADIALVLDYKQE